MSRHLTPLEVCERIFGDLPAVARICGKHEKSAYAWRYASKWRDAGDLPSAREQRCVLARASARGLTLPSEWLIWGASEAEVSEAMAACQAREVAA